MGRASPHDTQRPLVSPYPKLRCYGTGTIIIEQALWAKHQLGIRQKVGGDNFAAEPVSSFRDANRGIRKEDIRRNISPFAEGQQGAWLATSQASSVDTQVV